MNRQNILTAGGIALSLGIAVGGWFLTDLLIDRRSDALLSLSGTAPAGAFDARQLPEPAAGSGGGDGAFQAQMPSGGSVDGGAEGSGSVDVLEPYPSEDAPDVEPTDRVELQRPLPQMTEDEIISFLQMLQGDGIAYIEQRPDPEPGMIDEEAAIRIAQESLMKINDYGILDTAMPDIPTKANEAVLYRLVPDDWDFYLGFAYWEVTLSDRWIKSQFIINALTGQVWMIGAEIKGYMLTTFIDTYLIERTMAMFATDAGIENFNETFADLYYDVVGGWGTLFFADYRGQLNFSAATDTTFADTDTGAARMDTVYLNLNLTAY